MNTRQRQHIHYFADKDKQMISTQTPLSICVHNIRVYPQLYNYFVGFRSRQAIVRIGVCNVDKWEYGPAYQVIDGDECLRMTFYIRSVVREQLIRRSQFWSG